MYEDHVRRMCCCCESRSVAHAKLWSCPGGHHVAMYEECGAHLEEARGAHGENLMCRSCNWFRARTFLRVVVDIFLMCRSCNWEISMNA